MPNFTLAEGPISKKSATAAPMLKQPVLEKSELFAWFGLQRQLGIGSAGPVWLAQDYSVRRKVDQVALKFLPDALVADKIAFESLKDKVHRAALLKHPNILRVYDFVESKGRAAISTEYVDGQSLSLLRLAKPHCVFEVRDLHKWVNQVCEALEYAHKEAGPIHGDIVPGNLLISPSGDLKLQHFGITSCLSGTECRQSMEDCHTTNPLPHKSPPRVAGKELATTDDLYSLGATIYELLTSSPPFYGDETNARINGKSPPAMSERRAQLGIKGEAIPKNWEETVAACLAKDPAQRPQSAIEVEKRLKNTASPAGNPAKGRFAPESVPGPQSPVRSFFTRNPWLMVTVILFLAIGSAIGFFSLHHPTKSSAFTPAMPPFSPESTAKENSLPVATADPALSSTPSPDPIPIPTPEASPTPSLEASPTPSLEVSPTPSPEASPTPSPEARSVPSFEVSSKPFPEASPLLSPEISQTPSPELSPASTAEGADAKENQPAESIPVLSSQADTNTNKEDVVKRINALPGLTAEKKASLIGKMNKARSMERLTVVQFDIGQSALRKAAADEMVKAFNKPEMRDELSDPTIVLVVAGYADAAGQPDKNLRISQERAENVSKILKEKAKLLNAMQTIGMGGTELLDSKRPDQNRAVEIWAVVPL
jgi:serine/threonine protein kinase